MPVRLILALCVWLLAGIGAPVPPRDIDPPLWVVRDGDTVIWLFGSMHLLPADLGWFDDAVRTAFEQSDTLVLETVTADAATAQAIQDRLGKTAGGPTLPDRLPPAYRPKLAAAIAAAGYPQGALDQAEPWLAATTLSALPLRRAGYDPRHGVEAVLAQAAQAAGKPVTGLESRAQQLGYFDALPDAAQMAMLTRTLDGLTQTSDSADRVLAAWGAGDAATLGAIIDADQRRAPAAFTNAILTQRNRRWAGWIEARLRRPGTVFVAVGVGHLTGCDTVQRELARRGVKAVRVRY